MPVPAEKGSIAAATAKALEGCCDGDEHSPADGHSHDHGHTHDQIAHPGHADTLPIQPSRAHGDLASHFATAEALYHHVIDGDAMAGCGMAGHTHDEAAHVRDGIAALLRCANLVRSEGIFSNNERVEDINTEALRYFLIEYYLACLRQRVGDMSTRHRQLLDAKAGLEAFIGDMLRRGVVPKSEISAMGFSAFVEEDENSPRAGRGAVLSDDNANDGPSSSVASARAQQIWAQAGAKVGAGSGGPRIDPAAQRAQKIERFKRNAAAKKRLRELALLHSRIARLNAASGGGGGSEAGDTGAPDGVGSAISLSGIDEEQQREMALLALQTAARSALDDLASIEQELPILRHMASAREAQRGGPGRAASAAGALDDARMAPDERARAYVAGGPPPTDRSVDPTRKGLVSYNRASSRLLTSAAITLAPSSAYQHLSSKVKHLTTLHCPVPSIRTIRCLNPCRK